MCFNFKICYRSFLECVKIINLNSLGFAYKEILCLSNVKFYGLEAFCVSWQIKWRIVTIKVGSIVKNVSKFFIYSLWSCLQNKLPKSIVQKSLFIHKPSNAGIASALNIACEEMLKKKCLSKRKKNIQKWTAATLTGGSSTTSIMDITKIN